MMYSAYKQNKQGDNTQPWCTPFPILNQSVIPCPVLTVSSWSAYRFLKRQVRWSGISISLRIVYSLLWSTQLRASVLSIRQKKMLFWNFLVFFLDPMDVGNLVSGFPALSKSTLNIWEFLVYVLLKPGLKDFEHYLASMWNECNCAVVWAFFGIALLWYWNENWPFLVLWPLLSFPNFLAYWVYHFHSIIF